jgi:hypothetical protein
MIEPRCLIDEEDRAPLFQYSFVGHGKRFRGPWWPGGPSAMERP